MVSNRCAGAVAFALAVVLSACGERETASDSAEDFAARINSEGEVASGAAPQQGAGTPARKAPQAEGAAPGPYEPGTQTDPSAASCGAPDAADAIGKPFDSAGDIIRASLPANGQMRVLMPGAVATQDYNPARLNVMLDANRIVRDLRCG